jgi:hypothetical protein
MDKEINKKELDKLGHGIAFDSAVSLIESHCLMVPEEQAGTRDWYDVDPDAVDIEAENPVEESVRYLEMRGLIVRHPSVSTWIRILDESEATA